MTELTARSPGGYFAMNKGDSYTFQMDVDLPGIQSVDRGKLAIEVFVLDPNNGLAGFHICDAVMSTPGGQIVANQTDPIYSEVAKAGYENSVVEKARFELFELHTDALQSATDLNQLTVTFTAIMVGTSDLLDATDYFITAGAEYLDEEYVWVGQQPVTSSLVSQVRQTE